jgi:glycine dehydrogenase subunit 1
MDYVGTTEEDRMAMLNTIGVKDVEALFKDIPSNLRSPKLDMPKGRSEMSVKKHLEHLAGKNATDLTLFLGAGFYDHYVPSVVDSITRRGEFYTAYTP